MRIDTVNSIGGFLSTLSLRRATLIVVLLCHHISISIHALLAESDHAAIWHMWIANSHFYPRSPCGERPLIVVLLCHHISISIHALLAESDD